MQVLEFVTSKLKSGVKLEEYLHAVRLSQKVLRKYEGLLNRTLLHAEEEDLWIDLVDWHSMQTALAAAEQVKSEPDIVPLFSSLDPDNDVLRYFKRMDKLALRGPSAHIDCGCVEVLLFKLKPNVQTEQFIKVVEQVGELMRTEPEFIGRETYLNNETGEWLELVRYQDKEAAFRLFERIKDSECMLEGHTLVDESSMSMYFATPVHFDQSV